MTLAINPIKNISYDVLSSIKRFISIIGYVAICGPKSQTCVHVGFCVSVAMQRAFQPHSNNVGSLQQYLAGPYCRLDASNGASKMLGTRMVHPTANATAAALPSSPVISSHGDSSILPANTNGMSASRQSSNGNHSFNAAPSLQCRTLIPASQLAHQYQALYSSGRPVAMPKAPSVPTGTKVSVSYTHLTLPTNREV